VEGCELAATVHARSIETAHPITTTTTTTTITTTTTHPTKAGLKIGEA